MPGIISPGATGVIYCTDRAMANGFTYDDESWANLVSMQSMALIMHQSFWSILTSIYFKGQGAPETGPLPDAPPRPDTFKFPVESFEYAPTTGIKALRTAVANLYNVTYRQNMPSQYTAENVCIVPGGRAGLTRVAAVIGDVYTGYQVELLLLLNAIPNLSVDSGLHCIF